MNRALFLKTLLVAALAGVLMLPVAMIRDLVAERQARRNEAVSGIAEGWGKAQTVAGPYLAIPYERHWTGANGDARESQVLRLPVADAAWTIDAQISEKARGIHKARLYTARLHVAGSVDVPARARYEDGTSRYKWGVPRLVLGISDPLGIRAASDVSLGGATYGLVPGSGDSVTVGGLHAPLVDLPLAEAQKVDFSLTLELGGSEVLSIAPLGADWGVTMRANWPHPSFQGRFLPTRHDIGREGFTASWKVSRFAAQGTADAGSCAFPCNRMAEQLSVSLIEPVGLYQQLERASKYGFVFIGLTAAAFMLIELLRQLAIHPVQYTLVGLALAMFFLLLTALSEHIGFAPAYAAATAACVGLITVYLMRVLRHAGLGLAFGGALAALYAMLYALIKAEDYSLLGGSLLLFGLLAIVMIATRRVDWYALTARRDPRTTAG